MDKLKSLTPLIDGDSLIYRVGFAVQGDEPVENCLHVVKKTLESIFEQFPERENQRLFIGGSNNFRDNVAKLPDVFLKPTKDFHKRVYKGNRDPNNKPFYYKEIREYMIDRWNAEVVDGKESDDAIGEAIWTGPHNQCIVAQDKDLKQIRGHYYNWVNKEYRIISNESADLYFWYQMFTGDRTDNIRGLDGIGEKIAMKHIKDLKKDQSRIKQRLVELYQKQYGNSYKQAMHDTAQLLFIHRATPRYQDYFK